MRSFVIILVLSLLGHPASAIDQNELYWKILNLNKTAGRAEIERKADALIEDLTKKMQLAHNDSEKTQKIFEEMSEIQFAKQKLLLDLPSEKEITRLITGFLKPDDTFEITEFQSGVNTVLDFINSSPLFSEDDLNSFYSSSFLLKSYFPIALDLALGTSQIDFEKVSFAMLRFLLKRVPEIAETNNHVEINQLHKIWSQLIKMELGAKLIENAKSPDEISGALDLVENVDYSEAQEIWVTSAVRKFTASEKLNFNQTIDLSLKLKAYPRLYWNIATEDINRSSDFTQLRAVFQLLRDNKAPVNKRENYFKISYELKKAAQRLDLSYNQVTQLLSGVPLNPEDKFEMDVLLLSKARTEIQFRESLERLKTSKDFFSEVIPNAHKSILQSHFLEAAENPKLSFEQLLEARDVLELDVQGKKNFLCIPMARAVRSERQLVTLFNEIASLPIDIQKSARSLARVYLPTRFAVFGQTQTNLYNKCGKMLDRLLKRLKF